MGDFMRHLSVRLDAAEPLFLAGKHQKALSMAEDILQDLITLGPSSSESEHSFGVLVASSRLLDEDLHACAEGCVCRAAFALCLQAAYELGNFTDLDALVLKYFSSFSSLPFEMLLLCLNLKIAAKQHEQVVQRVVECLDRDKLRRAMAPAQYETLVELLVFHGLVPLRCIDDALTFVRKNDRLSISTQQGFLTYLERVKTQLAQQQQQQQAKAGAGSAGSGTASSNGTGSLFAKRLQSLTADGAGSASGRSTPLPSTSASLDGSSSGTALSAASASVLVAVGAGATAAASEPKATSRLGRLRQRLRELWQRAEQQLLGTTPGSAQHGRLRLLAAAARALAFVAGVALALRALRTAAAYFGLLDLVRPLTDFLWNEAAKVLQLAFSNGFGRLFGTGGS